MRRRIVISSLEILNQKLNLRLPLKVRGVVIVIWGDGELSSLRLTFLIKFCTALCVCVCMCVCVCVCVDHVFVSAIKFVSEEFTHRNCVRLDLIDQYIRKIVLVLES